MKTFKRKVVILVEGEKTEVKYFNSFKKSDKYRRNFSTIDIDVYQPKDKSPKGLLKAAKDKIKKQKKNDIPLQEVWIVFDGDGHTGIPDAFNDIIQYNQGFKNKVKILIAFSNICFEYWILLHFEQVSKSFNRCDKNDNHEPNVIDYIKKNHDIDYTKSSYNFLNLIESKLEVALKNAIWLEKKNASESMPIYEINPYTDVHHLVNKIIKGFSNE
jgi:hypothetical protein